MATIVRPPTTPTLANPAYQAYLLLLGALALARLATAFQPADAAAQA